MSVIGMTIVSAQVARNISRRRFPASIVPDNWGYAGVDTLILLGVGRDLFVTKHVHPVYLYGLPMMILGQALTMYIYLTKEPDWMVIAHRIIG